MRFQDVTSVREFGRGPAKDDAARRQDIDLVSHRRGQAQVLLRVFQDIQPPGFVPDLSVTHS